MIQLFIPFELKDEFKKFGIKFNGEKKLWYLDSDDVPDELKDYVAMEVFVEYKDKDLYKKGIPSLRWFPDKKKWYCNVKDFEKFKKLKT